MARRRPSPIFLAATIGMLAAFVAWTVLLAQTTVLEPLNAVLLGPRRSLGSPAGQVYAAFALLTWPGVVYAGVLGLAAWAAQRRMRNLAVGLALSVGLGWGASLLIRHLMDRPRPPTALPVIVASGPGYPSSDQVAITAASLAVAVFVVVTRQRWFTAVSWRVSGVLLIVAVGFDRWWLGAHYVSDLIGGVLLGGLATSISMLVAGVHVLSPATIDRHRWSRVKPAVVDDGSERSRLRCAVVYNPSKIVDLGMFRRLVEFALSSRGWAPAIWLETVADDAGKAMTAEALRLEVDLVLGAGGDGTIRVICAGLAGTGVPFGFIPAGTGNLLARNLGIPLDSNAALDVAFDGEDRRIDVARITTDGDNVDDFMVMAGIGIDAMIMATTRPELKKAVGSAAYFVAAAKSATHPALHATIQVDDEPPFSRRAHVIVVGNVGVLSGNIPLIPDARADDGLLDLVVASPAGVRDWVRLVAQVLTRRKRGDPQLDRRVGRRIWVEVEEGDHFQLDGDTAGETHQLLAEVRPGALTLRMPRRLR